MKYVSTRGAAPELDFEEVLLAGLARDGGLYVPEHWPAVSPEEIRALAGAPYTEIALAVLRPLVIPRRRRRFRIFPPASTSFRSR